MIGLRQEVDIELARRAGAHRLADQRNRREAAPLFLCFGRQSIVEQHDIPPLLVGSWELAQAAIARRASLSA